MERLRYRNSPSTPRPNPELHLPPTDSKPSAKSKESKQKAAANRNTRIDLPDKSAHDTRTQVRNWLKEGVKIHYSKGFHFTGTIDNPIDLKDKTAPYPDDEIDQMLENVAEIKHLLFCRLLLSHANVLPAAIRANSVEEFLNNSEVTDADLRDLALKMDNPGLQEIRDACADLGRGAKEDEEDEEAAKTTQEGGIDRH